jgi:predicted unusual protein kinase regulating ubiquinone biosynthesis (AarF/ABC1/UbiB family)
VIPHLINVAETIMIMSYEPGESFEECKLNKYQKGKLAMLFGLFTRNNQNILNYNHGDLHKGNWKIRVSDKDDDHKLVIYDFGFCWSVPREKHHLIELTFDTFESSDKEHQELQNLADIMRALVIYDRDDKAEFRKRVDLFVKTKMDDLMVWSFSPVKLFKCSTQLCLQENIFLDPIMIQAIIVAIQCQLISQEYGLQSTSKKEIKSYEVYRGRYIDFLTFCKTKDIFHDYRVSIEDKLNDKQTKVKGLFDFIEMPDSIKALALAK